MLCFFVNNNRFKQPKTVRLYISSPYRHGVICFYIKIEIREKIVNTMPKALQILIILLGHSHKRERQQCSVVWGF